MVMHLMKMERRGRKRKGNFITGLNLVRGVEIAKFDTCRP